MVGKGGGGGGRVQEGARGWMKVGLHRQLTKDTLAVGDKERIFATLVSFDWVWDDMGSGGQCETACIHQSAAACKVHVCVLGRFGQLHLPSTGCYDEGALLGL